MNQQQKDNSFALFQNESSNPKAPHYKGKGMVNGISLEISGWKQVSKSGKKYISLKVSEPWNKGNAGASNEDAIDF